MKSIYFRQIILSVGIILCAWQAYSQQRSDSLSVPSPTIKNVTDSINESEEDLIIEYELTAEGDTIYRYRREAFDFGDVNKKPPTRLYDQETEKMQLSISNRNTMTATVQSTSSVDLGKYVGQIPFSEGMTPSGGKTYFVPITTAPVNSSAPQIAITYNSQSGNGLAGYGWNLSGTSAISVTGKTIHYDGINAPVDLSKPGECVFSLDGTRLVNNSGSPTEYQYETAQGFVLVKKHLYGANVAYFTVAYPNGSTATFGYTNNTQMKHIYPIREITDIKGYKINFDYVESGNNYYLTKVSYGGKTPAAHQAEIQFDYVDRTDFTTAYLASIPVSSNKLLKNITSRNKVNGVLQELCTYTLTHVLNDVQRLTQIDCSSGTSSLNPLRFSYEYYYDGQSGSLVKEYSQFIASYFSSSSGARPVYVRGKFIKNEFGDGLITFPGKFSPYTKTGEKVKKFLGIVTGRYAIYGSGYPADQDILLVPGLSFFSQTETIKTEEGFQTIQAVDVNGDGVDEIVKVNFGALSGNITTLKITVYTRSGSAFSAQSFTVPVTGVVSNQGETYSPMSRVYFFGDFRGTGKTQMLTVSHNQTFTGATLPSYFALIDLEARTKISETSLFSVGFSDDRHIYPLDMDGDGKMELCYATSSGLDVYGLSGNSFTKLYTTSSINRSQFNKNPVFGDLNADGKIDVLVPPNESYQDTQWMELPVWAPHQCPLCRGLEPISNPYDTNCKHCGQNLQQYYASNSYAARCRECSLQLQPCGGNNPGDPYNPGYPGYPGDPGNGSLCCPTHGSIIMTEVDNGYVNNGNIWTAYLSTGKSFTTLGMPIVNKEVGEQYLLMDINNDGNGDLLRVKNNQVNLYLNKNGKIQSGSSGSQSIPSGTKILPANASDYYGMSHFVAIEDAEVNCYSYTKDNSKANLLTTLTDSYGNRYTNRYLSMPGEWKNGYKENNYYPTNTYRSYPYFSLIAPLNLLQATDIYTGSYTSVKRYNYTYHGAVMHRTGLGFAGFEKVITSESVENVTVEEIRDPQLFGVTTRVDSPYKTVYYSYSQDNFTNKKNNPRLTYASETDKLTNVSVWTNYEYDAYNNPTKVTANYGSSAIQTVTAQTYDNLVSSGRYLIGQPLTKTLTRTRGGSSWIDKEDISYDAVTRLPLSKKTFTGTGGTNKTGETQWTYDVNGNVTSEKSAPYNVSDFLGTTYTYDASGRYLATATNALGQRTTYANYDKFGNARTVTDYKNRVITLAFDMWGQQTSATSPDGVVETVTPAWGGQGLYTLTKTITGQPTTIVHFDALGRELRKGNQRFNGQWQYVDNAYDNKGRLEKVSLPFKGSSPTHWNTYTYDTYNRPTNITEASGKNTTWSYSGLSVTETKNGIATTKTTDASGALVSVSDPGGTITYALRPDGQPSSITAPGGVITSFGYDAFGRQISIADPSAGTQTFSDSYTAAGVLTRTVTDANGKTVTTTSDKYGRITQVNRPEFNTSYAYNADGLLTAETSGNGTSAIFTYDDYDRPATTRENAPDGKWLQKTFAYANGNVASVQYTSQNGTIGTENFVYAHGHNTEIKLNNTTSIWKLTEENALGQPTKATTGTMARTYGYTAFGMPTGRAAGTVQNFTYNFDVQKGNLLSRTDAKRSKVETFGYDNLNRLSSIGTQQIGYAANGNITQMPGVGTLAYEKPDKPYQVTMVTPTGTAVPLRNQGVGYTSFQRPSTISEDNKFCTFTYNAGGDRVKMHVEQNEGRILIRYYLGKQYEIDVQAHGTSAPDIERLYLGGDAYSSPAVYVKENNVWKIYYICRDYLGSITHIANSDGSLKQELSYDAWGRLRDPVTQIAYAAGSERELFLGRGYTGHEHLPWFGLINMNARLYDPLLGRFLSPDPYVQMPDFTQNFNRYSYCVNNPLVYVDEDGEFIHLIIGAIIGGTINVIANWKTIKEKGFWAGAGYFGVGAVAGALSAGVGAGISSALVSGGSFGAGFLGTAAAKTAATSFISGAAIGAGAGGSGGFVTGFGNGLLGGKSFGQSLGQGALYGLGGAASGALIGGLWGGIDAAIDGRRFFDGARVTKEFVADVNVVAVKQIGDNNCLPASGESVNKSLGGNIDQAQLRSWTGGDPYLDPLKEDYFWKDIFEKKTPLNVRGVNGTSKLNDIVSTLNGGGRVTVGVAGSGNVGHSVVVQSVYLQTVQKVNGSVSSTVMYRVMDPGTGAFRNIPFSKIIGNVWHIKP